MNDRQWPTVAALGSAQTLAWASSYYLPAMLATPMARELGVTTPTVFATFSLALVISAMLGPLAGRLIDRWGGRPVLIGTNLVFAAGLGLLATAQELAGLVAGWLVIGVGMGFGLYEAAFSALVRLYGDQSRRAITGITLIAGFASTVGWPLTTLLEAQLGWRGACLAWAALHLLLGLPLNALLPRASTASWQPAAHPAAEVSPATGPRHPKQRQTGRAAMLLAGAFAVTWFTSTAMAAHLPRLLQAAGVGLAGAVALGALVGPAQVAGRLLEFGVLSRLHPLLSARLAAMAHPVGAVTLLAFGAPLAPAFALLHGAGNGILTIAKGTLPLALFGTAGYGARLGLLMAPSRFAQALAPPLFGLCLDHWGANALWVSSVLGLLAFAALMALPRSLPGTAARAPARVN